MATKDPKFQSFEVQGIPYDQDQDRSSLIKQIVGDMVRELPTIAVTVSLNGNELILRYVCYEKLLSDPQRMRETEHAADAYLNDIVKRLKKEFKSRSGKSLSLKEDKDRRQTSAEKVSLNLGYYYRSQRVYELKEE